MVMGPHASELCAATPSAVEPHPRASSSITIAYETVSVPVPPYSTGTTSPMNPSSPIMAKRSTGNSLVWSSSEACGASSVSAKRRAVS